MKSEESVSRPVEAMRRFTELADYIIPFTIRSISDLGVADHLKDGPKTVEALAQATDSNAQALHRALLALASKGIFAETTPGTFQLTPMAELLLSDHPQSLRDGYRMLHADIQAWSRFDYSLRTGRASFDIVHGQNYWDFLATHSDYSRRFDRAMASFSRLELRAVLGAYDFSGIATLADCGGGNGTMISGLLKARPELKGILFDQPHVVKHADAILAQAGVSQRCRVVAGSIFTEIPAGADAYMFKRVIYDFDDQEVEIIFKNVRKAIGPSGRILVVDPVFSSGNSSDVGTAYSRIYDLLMLAMVSGHSRSPEQIEKLFVRSGFRMTNVVPTVLFPVIEGRPA